MLAEERLARIVEMVEREGTATVTELAGLLGTSESTIRRDLDKLDQAHRLVKVHGGATTRESAHITRDLTLTERSGLHDAEKRAIAEHAAGLIGPDDFVYVDAGTSTEALVSCITETRALYVTDSVSNALKLAARGCRVTVLGGELKSATEALVGPDALSSLERYHFTLGFWGANGITPDAGFTTPDRNEAMVKQVSMEHTERRYVLSDASKFGRVGLVSFAPFERARVLTAGNVPDAYRSFENVVEVGR